MERVQSVPVPQVDEKGDSQHSFAVQGADAQHLACAGVFLHGLDSIGGGVIMGKDI